jgi:hypothetical protein
LFSTSGSSDGLQAFGLLLSAYNFFEVETFTGVTHLFRAYFFKFRPL